jgi:hypothetical protein
MLSDDAVKADAADPVGSALLNHAAPSGQAAMPFGLLSSTDGIGNSLT